MGKVLFLEKTQAQWIFEQQETVKVPPPSQLNPDDNLFLKLFIIQKL